MKALQDKILKEGIVKDGGVLKVDGFVNHRIDVAFMNEVGKEFKRLFEGVDINKIVTIEASGIGIACIVAQYFNAPVVFAKKNKLFAFRFTPCNNVEVQNIKFNLPVALLKCMPAIEKKRKFSQKPRPSKEVGVTDF